MNTETTITPDALRDEFAMRAPVDLHLAARICGYTDDVAWTDPVTLRTIMVVGAMARYQWAEAMLAQRDEALPPPGTPAAPTEDRRLDRLLVTLGWWDYRIIVPLKKAGIETLRELLALDVYALDAIKGIGTDGLRDVVDRVIREGLSLQAKQAPQPATDVDATGTEAVGT